MKKSEKIVKFLEKRYGSVMPRFKGNPYKVLIACILSQRTREENTEKVSNALFKVADTPKKISEMPLKKLQRLIKSSGTYKQKARNIKLASKIILEKYHGKVPISRTQLIGLPGVGPKTADIVRSYGYGEPTIAIDTHANRIPKRLGIAEWEDDLETVKEKLEKFIPKKKWMMINISFVSFGREICRPINPKCFICELKEICKAYKTKRF